MVILDHLVPGGLGFYGISVNSSHFSSIHMSNKDFIFYIIWLLYHVLYNYNNVLYNFDSNDKNMQDTGLTFPIYL